MIDRPENTIPIVRIVKVNEYIDIAREHMKGYSVYIISDTDKIVALWINLWFSSFTYVSHQEILYL